MGYSHYLYTPKEIKKRTWNKITKDVKIVLEYIDTQMGVKLANGSGEPNTSPDIDGQCICFNGSDAQPAGLWTTNENISLPWPSNSASITDTDESPISEKTDGTWFAGDLVSQRVAPVDNLTGLGSGSYETCYIDRISEGHFVDREKLYFSCCKTAYRPYDIAVTAVYLIVKHYVPECIVRTDGKDKDWLDARILLENLLQYGMSVEVEY